MAAGAGAGADEMSQMDEQLATGDELQQSIALAFEIGELARKFATVYAPAFVDAFQRELPELQAEYARACEVTETALKPIEDLMNKHGWRFSTQLGGALAPVHHAPAVPAAPAPSAPTGAAEESKAG
jgi:hypothetical protein